MDEADVRGFILNHFGQGIMLPLLLFVISTYLVVLNQAAGCSTSGETFANRYALQAYTNTTNVTVEEAASAPPPVRDEPEVTFAAAPVADPYDDVTDPQLIEMDGYYFFDEQTKLISRFHELLIIRYTDTRR